MLPNTGSSSSSSLARVKDVGDLRLTNTQGIEIAKVKEAVLDPASGQLRYVLVKLENENNPVEKIVPIPFEKVSWNSPNQEFLVLNADPALLNSAPSYPSEDAIPDTAAPGWDGTVKQFWAGK
jgi:sporulation protein YlmC with PRC-barrel domain